MAERAQVAAPPPPPRAKRSAVPWLIGALVVAALVVAGLVAVPTQRSGDDSPAAGTAAAPPSGAVAAPRGADEYDVAQRLVGALNQAGIDCLNWEETKNPLFAVYLGSCYVGTEQVVVAIHRSHAEAADEPTRKGALLKGVSDVHIVVGGNWTVSCDSVDLCTRIERDFGDSYVLMPA